ncbi:MAG TPA: peptidylprolyl isomerase [Dehalococcoidia bacterium]|nr:peptidylprolyl isomerase [Dehalococcoidia bacterium]
MPPKQYQNPPSLILDPNMRYTATIKTARGDMTLELFPAEAPRAVNNFVFLARDGYYQGNCFHRVIRDFMIQGGCPKGDGTGGPGYKFPDEEVKRPYVKGTLAMANAGPNTNGSQFFIVHGRQVNLPPSYTIFGKLLTGEDILDTLATSPVAPGGEGSRPAQRLEILTVEIAEQPYPAAGKA